jgi:hypothetical protein
LIVQVERTDHFLSVSRVIKDGSILTGYSRSVTPTIRAACGRRDAHGWHTVTDGRPIVSESVTHGHTEGGCCFLYHSCYFVWSAFYQSNNDPLLSLNVGNYQRHFEYSLFAQRRERVIEASHDTTTRHDKNRVLTEYSGIEVEDRF